MPIATLSSGSMARIMSSDDVAKPILQILGSKCIKSIENSDRYRLLISDGQFFSSFVMLAAQLNKYMTDGRLSDKSIVRVDKYITSMVNKSGPPKRVLIVLGLEVLNTGAEMGRKIGEWFMGACPTPECNKKVVEGGSGGERTYRCEKCNAEFGTFKYRLLLNMIVSDWSSNTWVTCFSDLAEQLLQNSAAEIGEALEHNEDQAEKIMARIAFKQFVFKIRIKHYLYGDVMRTKTAVAATAIKYKERNQFLIKSLERMTGIAKL